MRLPRRGTPRARSRLYCAFLVFGVSLCHAASNCVPPAVSSDFKYHGKTIHPGCIDELTAQPNGDNVTSSVNLGRAAGRGCPDSNRYAMSYSVSSDGFVEYKQAATGDTFGYRHIREIAPGVHYLVVRLISQGSYASLTSLVVRYDAAPVLDLDGKRDTVRYVDRLSSVAYSTADKRELTADDYAHIRRMLQGPYSKGVCAPAGK